MEFFRKEDWLEAEKHEDAPEKEAYLIELAFLKMSYKIEESRKDTQSIKSDLLNQLYEQGKKIYEFRTELGKDVARIDKATSGLQKDIYELKRDFYSLRKQVGSMEGDVKALRDHFGI